MKAVVLNGATENPSENNQANCFRHADTRWGPIEIRIAVDRGAFACRLQTSHSARCRHLQGFPLGSNAGLGDSDTSGRLGRWVFVWWLHRVKSTRLLGLSHVVEVGILPGLNSLD